MLRLALPCTASWLVALAGSHLPAQAPPSAYDWRLPAGVRPPHVSAGNPMSDALVELGRHLFYDTRLSANGTQSCATSHEQARAVTQGRPQSVGSTGDVHPRGSMSLVNVAFASTLTWASKALTSLEDQALVPMYGTAPVSIAKPASPRTAAGSRRRRCATSR
jgi:cytochrome c peroxidase